ncbi:MAG: helix-turn-helix transcriptional regulator, partial [Proteobacteria bacterium]|nr:helix-turn-helix transcriptional regulator [Pseudomonadota bacterium]
KNDLFLDSIPAEHLSLKLTQNPYFQKQHSDYWRINGLVINDYDLFVCTGGTAEFRQGDKPVFLKEGEAILIHPHIPVYAEHRGDLTFTAMAQHFTLNIFGDLNFFSLVNLRNHIRFSDWTYVKTIHNRYKKLYGKKEKNIEWNSLFQLILMEFIYDAYSGEKNERSRTDSFILDMLGLFRSCFRDNDIVARACSLSPYSRDHTTRLFRKQVGISPLQYLINYKLSMARDNLQRNMSVKETAIACGFPDQLYFSRIFRKYTGMSPSEFKSRFVQ